MQPLTTSQRVIPGSSVKKNMHLLIDRKKLQGDNFDI